LEISEDALLEQLKGPNSQKGAGPDGLIPKVLKICCYQLAPVFTQLFLLSIKSKATPNLWKSAKIKPLPKVKNPELLKQYRRIALTSGIYMRNAGEAPQTLRYNSYTYG